jgi:Flp pilus assembly protein TadG
VRVGGKASHGLTARWRVLTSAEASQLLEFAVSLPLLVVLVVGIFDFGRAFNLKHELTNAAREGARFGASSPTADLTGPGIPNSVTGVQGIVNSYLVASGLNNCALGAPVGSGTSFTWTATGSGCPGGTLTLTIERAYIFKPAAGPNTNENVVSTHVSLSYPFQWRFASAIQLLTPGATYAGLIQITADSVMPNVL